MAADESILVTLASAILDGTPVDWAAASSGAEEVDRGLLRRLQQIAALADAHRPEAPETWGHLRLLERIGRGAFGDVYRAWDSRLDREVALKLLPVDAAAGDPLGSSIIEEGRLLARVRHPNVVTIYGAERIHDRVGLWMEYVSGRTLHQMVAEDGKRFSAQEVVTLGRELCGAVAAVHAAGLLHRDIKAQNVMVSNEGRVALMDFGTGQERSAPAAAMAGTPLYLAPEVLSGASSPTVAADIYSIGVLLYFLLTGTCPVVGKNLENLRAAHERGERRTLKAVRSDLPRRLCRVIERAIDPDPHRRYQRAESFASALAGTQSGRGRHAFSYGAAAAAVFLVAVAVWGPRAAAPDADRPQVAVLPFTNVSADPDDDYFADGLTDEIIRTLSLVRGLDVRSRTSSFAFKGQERNLADVGERLKVGYVVDGTILRAGGRVQVDAKLLKVGGGAPLWSNRFDRELTVRDIQGIQDGISRGIVDSLRLTLERSQPEDGTNLQAYELYLQARALAERGGARDPMLAAQYFQKVIDADPSYARAHAGLALAYAYMTMSPYQSVPFETAHPIMRRAAIEAVRLDPNLAEAQAARGWVHAREFEWDAAERAFERAIDLNPTLTLAYTSFVFSTLRPMGRVREAEDLLRRADRNDPLGTLVQRELGQVLFQAGRPAEAIPILERIRAVDSDLMSVEHTLGRALVAVGRVEESLPLLERHQQRLIDAGAGPHPWVAFAYVALGRRADAEALARKDDWLPFRRAIINAALGNTERMFHGLEEMATREPQRLVVLLRQPELAPYRADPRFADLLRRLKLPD